MKPIFIVLFLVLCISTAFPQFSGDKHPPCLPITLSSFTAVPSGNGVELKWTTTSEINNYGFFVEMLGSDGVFGVLPGSFHPGAGTTNDPQFYSYTSSSTGTFRLQQVDTDGTTTWSESVTLGVTGVKSEGIVTGNTLIRNYPNPFNPTTNITYILPVGTDVHLVVYDMMGREVQTLVNSYQIGGEHSVQFIGTGLSSGTYLCVLKTPMTTQKQKMLLVK